MIRRTPRVWPRRVPKTIVVAPDPYKPGSPGYAERHREYVDEPQPGTIRVTKGQPHR